MCNCKSNYCGCGCNLCCNIIKNIFGISYSCPAKKKISAEETPLTLNISESIDSKKTKSSTIKKATKTKKTSDIKKTDTKKKKTKEKC